MHAPHCSVAVQQWWRQGGTGRSNGVPGAGPSPLQTCPATGRSGQTCGQETSMLGPGYSSMATAALSLPPAPLTGGFLIALCPPQKALCAFRGKMRRSRRFASNRSTLSAVRAAHERPHPMAMTL
eukprot:scaffold26141_cov13-Tisochrysis_lutea.AAC.1